MGRALGSGGGRAGPRSQRGKLGWGRRRGPRAHSLIPRGDGVAAATTLGPGAPPASLACPLSVSLSKQGFLRPWRPRHFSVAWKGHFLTPQSLLDFCLIPNWGKPQKGWTHFLQATLEAESQEVTKGMGAAQSLPGRTGGTPPCNVPAPVDGCPAFSGQQPRPAGRPSVRRAQGRPRPSPFSPPHLLALLCVSKAATPLSGAPDHPAGEKRENWGICLFKKRLMWYVFFETPTYHNSG